VARVSRPHGIAPRRRRGSTRRRDHLRRWRSRRMGIAAGHVYGRVGDVTHGAVTQGTTRYRRRARRPPWCRQCDRQLRHRGRGSSRRGYDPVCVCIVGRARRRADCRRERHGGERNRQSLGSIDIRRPSGV
jgi:hypothetical protein